MPIPREIANEYTGRLRTATVRLADAPHRARVTEGQPTQRITEIITEAALPTAR